MSDDDKKPFAELTDGYDSRDPLLPENISKQDDRQTAVAIKDNDKTAKSPQIVASGRGKLAEQILELAFANGIKVREDKDLAELLARIDIDTPIPTEALMAVAEILSYVYRANGQQALPFQDLLDDILKEELKDIK